MKICVLPQDYTVCKLYALSDAPLDAPMLFLSRTDEEISLVCPTECVPAVTHSREDGWRAMRVEGQMEFSLVGILAGISGALAQGGVSLFAVSTYNTDYVLVKAAQLDAAADCLKNAGYAITFPQS